MYVMYSYVCSNKKRKKNALIIKARKKNKNRARDRSEGQENRPLMQYHRHAN